MSSMPYVRSFSSKDNTLSRNFVPHYSEEPFSRLIKRYAEDYFTIYYDKRDNLNI